MRSNCCGFGGFRVGGFSGIYRSEGFEFQGVVGLRFFAVLGFGFKVLCCFRIWGLNSRTIDGLDNVARVKIVLQSRSSLFQNSHC